ncbi:MAG: hypothetical protein KKE50_03730 [Nanoarchaeota archaeon]|nr:hypothetical protein [Nanoarchaeota archaeon]
MTTLTQFIKQARSRGFSDLQIRNALIENKWSLAQIEHVFQQLNPKFKLKNQICIFLSHEMIQKLGTRAKKNMFTLSEQIEDILRRSCSSGKKTPKEEKLDDALVSLFSRRR